jgi:glycyl-tRNA synthetase beta subunit
MVMADDPVLRAARLTLLSRLRDRILEIGDIAEMAPDEIK